MGDMIERVTEAVIAINERLSWSEAREIARAAIEAMREPTDAMISAGGSWTNDEEFAQAACYRAMIDAAVK